MSVALDACAPRFLARFAPPGESAMINVNRESDMLLIRSAVLSMDPSSETTTSTLSPL